MNQGSIVEKIQTGPPPSLESWLLNLSEAVSYFSYVREESQHWSWRFGGVLVITSENTYVKPEM